MRFWIHGVSPLGRGDLSPERTRAKPPRAVGVVGVAGRMRMRRLLKTTGTIMVAAALLLIPDFAAPALTFAAGSGTANCSDGPGQVNRWKGESYSDANAKQGASGTISSPLDLNNCTNPGLVEISGSFVWSNVVPVPGGFNDIVQMGIGNCRYPFICSGGNHYYTGYGRTSTTPGCAGYSNRSPVATELGTPSLGPHDLKVRHVSGSWYFYSGNTVEQITADSNVCWTGKEAVWFGESLDAGDAIGGPTSDPAEFDSTNYSNTIGGGFIYTPFNPSQACNYANPGAVYHCDILSSTSILIWTAR